MKNIWIILFTICFAPSLFAAEQKTAERSVLSAIGHLEARGFSNALLFPAEWGHLPKAEYGSAFSLPFVALTHMGGRLFSGIGDIVILPLAYPFTRYDDSLPERMGWGEFPWDKPQAS